MQINKAKLDQISYLIQQFMASTAIRAAIGKASPFFKGQAWNCKKGSFEQLSLDNYKGKYLLLFFYPLNFTYVCPTQIIQFSKKAAQFRHSNCEVVGCSIDSHFSHMEYTKKPRKQGGIGEVDIPLLSDINKTISTSFGVLNDGGLALRGSVIIDDEAIVRHISINDLSVGRNVDEYLRLVNAFKFAKQNKQVCPANWKQNDKGMVPDYKSAELASYWKNIHDKQ